MATKSQLNHHILHLARRGMSPFDCRCDMCYGPLGGALSAAGVASPSVKIKRGGRSGSFRKRARGIRIADKVCRYCMDAPAETVDHVIPTSRGGSNSRLNMVGCCDGCNQKKGDALPKEVGMILHIPLRMFNY